VEFTQAVIEPPVIYCLLPMEKLTFMLPWSPMDYEKTTTRRKVYTKMIELLG